MQRIDKSKGGRTIALVITFIKLIVIEVLKVEGSVTHRVNRRLRVDRIYVQRR